MRMRMIWATRSGSHTASTRPPVSRSSRCDSWAASAGVNSAATFLASSPTSVGSGRSSSEPASRRERSSSSVASLPRRSTCWRSWRRKAARVSSSSSSSSSSSRKPLSEKIGVRSSCEAVAMKRRRAVSSSASWRCMASSVRASWPSSSRAPDSKRAPKSPCGHAAGGMLHAPDPAAERPREQVAGEQRAEQRERAGDEHALADERRRGVDVLQRRRVDRDVVDPGLLRARRREPQRQRRLGHAADVARLGPARDPPGARRLEGDGELQVADLALGGRVRGDVGLQPLGPAREAEQGDARARRVRRLAHARVERPCAASECSSASTIGPEFWRATPLSVSSFWSRTPDSRPEVTPR